jgi:hypothetical protein
MRWILVVALLASLSQGCFVLEEIDKGQQIMDQHSPRAREKTAKQEEAGPAPRAGAKQEEKPFERLKKWWKEKREPGPPEPPKRDPDDVIVRCEIGGTMQFARKFDCMLRGGRVL